MAKKKGLLVFLVAAVVLTGIFYFAGFKVVINNTLGSLMIRLTRVEKEILYTAQALLPFRKNPDVVLKVRFHKQEHALSCEIAALKMILNYHGVAVSEDELLRDLPFDTAGPRSKNNVWGDPDRGFVGDIDGKIPNIGYGVYENPIVDLALQYREAKKMESAALADVLNEVASGHPVIVWGSLGSGKDISWQTASGRPVKAVYGEHTRVLIGYGGAPENPKYVVLLDPIYGRITMSKNKFIKDWALLGNKAVVVY
ncbi:MAG: C39 family peptidase [Parcubacteria group bacterium]|nr:C39 family peptidase [Parcubacteria group bacterium]